MGKTGRDDMMRKIMLIASFFILTMSSVCIGYYGGSNLGYGRYPSFSRMQPTKPFSKDRILNEMYKNDVEEYIRKAKEYIENANNDIEMINEEMESAVRRANQVVNEYNMYVTTGY